MDVQKLLQPVSESSPTGDDLEYTDTRFREMEEAAAGKPDREMGDATVPGEEPDWKEVRRLALALLADSKDLRTAVYLVRSAARVDGVAGLRDGLQVIRGLVDQYWASLHPLDPDDRDDPDMRLNALVPLGHSEGLVADVTAMQVVASRAVGQFTVRDVRVAAGELPASGGEAPDPKLIEAAFLDCDLDELQQTAAAMGQALEALAAIEAALVAAAGAERVPDFAPLSKLLTEMARMLHKRLGERGAQSEDGAEADGVAPVGGPAAARPSGEIRSREDVARLLDLACEYYRRHEPGSPVPLLLQRAKRLISMNFMELIEDLAPDGTAQAQRVCGVVDSE